MLGRADCPSIRKARMWLLRSPQGMLTMSIVSALCAAFTAPLLMHVAGGQTWLQLGAQHVRPHSSMPTSRRVVVALQLHCFGDGVRANITRRPRNYRDLLEVVLEAAEQPAQGRAHLIYIFYLYLFISHRLVQLLNTCTTPHPQTSHCADTNPAGFYS